METYQEEIAREITAPPTPAQLAPVSLGVAIQQSLSGDPNIDEEFDDEDDD